MLRLLSAARTASHLPAAASLLRFSTITASPAPFVAKDYLVTTCGLTPAKALESSKHLDHVKSPLKADAVRTFLAGAGLAKGDIAAAIARHPQLLCSKVDKTLNPRMGMLLDIGLSPAQISSLIAIVPNVERVVKPNISFLQQCGLTDLDIVQIFLLAPRMFMLEPERVKEIVACVGRLVVPPDSAMFRYALISVYRISPGRINARWDFLKKALGCSEDELSIAVCKLPDVLNFTEDRMSRVVQFLKMEVGLKTEYIVNRPALLTYSMKRWLMPRHNVLKVLKEKGSLKKEIDFFSVVYLTDEVFAKKFLDPYKEGIPGLAADYGEQVAP